jgi:TrwC relaxase
VEWTARDDGHGFEIKGISGDMMRVFSSRRASITADLRARAARFEQRYGRAPSQRELAQLAQASNFKTRAAKESALDFAQLQPGPASGRAVVRAGPPYRRPRTPRLRHRDRRADGRP